MATIESVVLPAGWTKMTGIVQFDVTRLGRNAHWQFVGNADFGYWEMTVNYLRSEYETDADLTFDDLYAFFVTSRNEVGFLVDDLVDNTDESKNGEGVILELDGDWRLFKRYTSDLGTYDHPITRPKDDVVVSAGTLDSDTGIVTGISTAGTWTGGFYRPMVFMENGLQYELSPDGTLSAFNIRLQEQLEV